MSRAFGTTTNDNSFETTARSDASLHQSLPTVSDDSPPKMRLPEVPQEIWDQIIQFAHGSDWTQLRLVCKAFEIRATKCAFSDLTVCLQEKSLTRLVAISKIARLAQHVVELEISDFSLRERHEAPVKFVKSLLRYFRHQEGNRDDDYDDEYDYDESEDLSEEEFERVTIAEFLNMKRQEVLLDKGYGPREVFSLYRKSGKILYDHCKFLHPGLDVILLASALSRFPNLTIIRLEQRACKACTAAPWGVIGDNYFAEIEIEDRIRGDGVTPTFLRAVATAPVLRISRIYWRGDENYKGYFWTRQELNSEDFLSAVPCFQQLVCLEYDAEWNHDYSHLQLIPLLEHLSCLEVFAWRYSRRCIVDMILDALVSTQLRVVTLESCSFLSRTFRQFIAKHKASLKQLSFTKCFLLELSFQELFIMLRDQLHLDTLVLRSYLKETTTSEIRTTVSNGLTPISWGIERPFHLFGNGYAKLLEIEKRGGGESNEDIERCIVQRKQIEAFVTHKSDQFPTDLDWLKPNVASLLSRMDLIKVEQQYGVSREAIFAADATAVQWAPGQRSFF